MVARNGKAVTPEEIIMAEKEKEIIETEKEHLGDIEKGTGIYAPELEKLEKAMVVEIAQKPITIYDELNRIQTQLHAPKTQFNKFGNYKYRKLEDILEGYKLVQGDTSIVISDEIVNIGDRFYVKATATLYYKGESVSNTAYAREALSKKGMDDSQLTGSTSTYARKYALNGLFSIDDNEDADSMDNTQNNNSQPAVKKEPEKTTVTEKKYTEEEKKELYETFTKLLGACNSLNDLKLTWDNVPENIKPSVLDLKNERKEELRKKQQKEE